MSLNILKGNLRALIFMILGQTLFRAGSRALGLNMNMGPRVMSTLNPILVSIEGNIGAGKTTLLNSLRKSHPEWIFIDEPVDTWSEIKNQEGESILEVFYRDRKRWSYTFQTCALLTRYQNIEKAVNNERMLGKLGNLVFLTERCLDTDSRVFTKMLTEEGSINSLELDLYGRLLTQLKATATPLTAIVHVNTSPEVCAERIRKRSRGGEEAISMEYLKNLHGHQSRWIKEATLPTLPTEVTHSSRQVEEFIAGLAVGVSAVNV
mmetsp:Transcript_28661/g.63621  ORF Transcript_28661/g.63621 Transcript_28661/m.63621 type:complete len:264 (+) Transcript_28661:159-950(+)|eukprot:CAMPEP_0173204606 /NCGR_PEP_ID=MMETSP1141-20130122/20226_1 /TAXON_ID=483371 /ORGANISM="non described non described, Strain CCMP2298" /LENGTH=263 /DNA_ID=CAMNT_0014130309 /DNA_START=124 /DNA_END=915 /DNA_ORIENTATION=+